MIENKDKPKALMTNSQGKKNHSVMPGALVVVRPLGTRSRVQKLMHTEIHIGNCGTKGSAKWIRLNDPYLNTNHCRLLLKDDGYWIEDLNSQNGVYLNDIRVQRARVTPGAKLRFGMSSVELLKGNCDSQEKDKTAYSCQKFKTVNPDLASKLSTLIDYSKSDLPVLLSGESGCGKELLARAVHEYSNRSGGVFTSLNCAAISQNLLESELFGHVRGAFTGAERDRKGAFMATQGGTLFLDEIGELPSELQAKLLRTLESSEVKPLGADKSEKVNVRLVAATNRDLAKMVEKGSFRLDLYYRICVLNLDIPPLRERTEDIRFLAEQFAREKECLISSAAMEDLMVRKWKGNTRELRNVIYKSSIHAKNRRIEKSHLYGEDPLQEIINQSVYEGLSTDEQGILKRAERRLIMETLELCNGNRELTAKKLGIAKSTLFQKLKDFKSKKIA